MGILLIPAAEMRIEGADIILLNVSRGGSGRAANLCRRAGFAGPARAFHFYDRAHPFYVLGGSIGTRLLAEIDCFDAIEHCHFHRGPLNPNRRAARVARRFQKPLIATSDAHRLHAFGRHFTSMPRPAALTCEICFCGVAGGSLRLDLSPAATLRDLVSTIYFIFLSHPARLAVPAAACGNSGQWRAVKGAILGKTCAGTTRSTVFEISRSLKLFRIHLSVG